MLTRTEEFVHTTNTTVTVTHTVTWSRASQGTPCKRGSRLTRHHKFLICFIVLCAVQAGFKYWLVLCIVFEVTLVVLYALPLTRPLNPSFGFVAASLTMSERVEATVSKVSAGFWLQGSQPLLLVWCC